MAAFLVVVTLSCFMCADSFRVHQPGVQHVFTDVDNVTVQNVSGSRSLYHVPAEHHCEERSYLSSSRHRCDAALYHIIASLYTEHSVATSLYTSLEDEGFKAAWQCYAQDPCFMSPPGPSEVHLSVERKRAGWRSFFKQFPVVAVRMTSEQGTAQIDLPITPGTKEMVQKWELYTKSFRWYPFEEWRAALVRAVSEAISLAGRRDIYLAIHVGSPGAGNSESDDPLFNSSLSSQYPVFMHKSELWTLIHVLNAFWAEPGVKGVFWLQGGKGQIPVKESAVLMPLDASYSGLQMAISVSALLRRTHPSVTVYAAVGIAKAELMREGAEDIYGQIASGGLQTASASARDAIKKRCAVLAGRVAQEMDFAPQFKLPDAISMEGASSELLRCALCCSGEDTKRAPYKFFTQRRLDRESCASVTASAKLGFECSCP